MEELLEEEIIISGTILLFDEALKRKRKAKKRRWWMTQVFKNREVNTSIVADIRVEPEYKMFCNFARMSVMDFEWLLGQIGPAVAKQDTHYRKSIPITDRLAVTMRFLATGDSYTSLSYLFKISKQSISAIVPEVCHAILEALKTEVQTPTNSDQWIQIASEFQRKWDFPHCIGAIDGKHCIIQNPKHGGGDFYNYKSTCSVVLMAAVDANYNFIYANVGAQGRLSDGGVFRNTNLFNKLQNNDLDLPPCAALPSREMEVPFVFVTDDAFSLHQNIMKPYSGQQQHGSIKRIFNYRLSRARNVVENAFGIMSAVFRVLRKPMLLEPDKASTIVMACVHLHNFLRRSKMSRNIYSPIGTFDSTDENGCTTLGSWRSRNEDIVLTSFTSLRNIPRRSAASNELIRCEYSEYFATVGQVPWQNRYA